MSRTRIRLLVAAFLVGGLAIVLASVSAAHSQDASNAAETAPDGELSQVISTRAVEWLDAEALEDGTRLKEIHGELTDLAKAALPGAANDEQRRAILGPAIASVTSYLESPDRRTRCKAGLVLDALGDERGVAAVIKELEDQAPRPADLGQMRSDGTPNVHGQIRSDRYYAALLLGLLGNRAAVPALIRATEDEAVHYRAAISLGQIGDLSAIPALREMARNFPDEKLWAGYGLAALGEEDGFEMLYSVALTDSLPTERSHAVEALGTVGDFQAVPIVMAVAVADVHVNVRVSAVRALGKIGDPSALPALRVALQDKEETQVNAPTTVAIEAEKAIAKIEAARN